MAQKPGEIVFSKERRVFFSKQSLNEELFQNQKGTEANKETTNSAEIIKSTPVINEQPKRTKLKD